MRVPFMLVFHQRKCTSAIKRIPFYYFHVYIFEFIRLFACYLLLRCMLKPLARRVGVKTLYAINENEPESFWFQTRKGMITYYSIKLTNKSFTSCHLIR